MHNIVLWFGLAVIPFIWFFQNVVHEGSHAIWPLFHGSSVKLYPWPKFMHGRWYMAYMTYVGGKTYSKREDLLISASPRIVDLLIIIVTTFIQPVNPWVNTLLQAWQIAALMDFSFNTVGILYPATRRNDAWACAELAEIKNITRFRVLSLVSVLVAATPVAIRFFF